MKYTPVGVDIAKHLIQVHFIDENTGDVVDKQLRRRDFLEYFSNRESCLIGMEACGGSQHWARELTKLGHKVRLLQARFVKAFVMGNKNDVMDARAIWMAVQQPGKEIAVKTEEQQSVLVLHRSRRQLVKFRTMQINSLQARFVKAFVMGNKNDVMDARAIWMAVQQPGKEIAVKTEEQQSVLVLHRSRRQLVKFRTMQINSLHGTLLEFGETIHKGRAAMEREFPEALERMKERLPPYLITVLENQYNRLMSWTH